MDEARRGAFWAGLACVIVMVVNEPVGSSWVLNVLAPLFAAGVGSWAGYRAEKWLRSKGWL